jgi:hypothetical protein
MKGFDEEITDLVAQIKNDREEWCIWDSSIRPEFIQLDVARYIKRVTYYTKLRFHDAHYTGGYHRYEMEIECGENHSEDEDYQMNSRKTTVTRYIKNRKRAIRDLRFYIQYYILNLGG